MNVLDALRGAPLWSQPPLAIAVNVVVYLAFMAIGGAVVLDFSRYHRQSRQVVRGDRSLVETGTMTAFFVAYYLVIRLGWSYVAVRDPVRAAMVVVGLALVVVGTVFNLWGRVTLKSGWANQIRVYEGQRLVTEAPFSVVRHPLYASLIWISVGGSLIYSNALSLVLALGVFVPMMYVRAKKEDAILEETFGAEYREYRATTGMFLPRVGGSRWRT